MIPTVRCSIMVLIIIVVGITNESAAQDGGVQRRHDRQAMLDWQFEDMTKPGPGEQEALEFFQRLALDPSNTDDELPDDFTFAVECLSELERIHELDAFLEDVLKAHPDNWQLKVRAASILLGSATSKWIRDYKGATIEVSIGGPLIAGQFRRGDYSSDGEWIDSTRQDHVRAIQLLLTASQLASNDKEATPRERAATYKQLADSLRSIGYQLFSLDELTDVSKVPEYASDPYGEAAWNGQEFKPGIPVDTAGNPIFYQFPESWDAAKSDGERWRWAVSQMVSLDPLRQSEVDLEWAEILDSQFGGQAVRNWGHLLTKPEKSVQAGESVDASSPPVHELSDKESMVLLKTGLKQMTLPDEFNPIVILKQVIARNDSQKRMALSALVNIRFGRRQYPQAADLLREILKTLDEEIARPGSDQPLSETVTLEKQRAEFRLRLQNGLDQILKNWVQFDASSVRINRPETTLDLKYRNGSKVTLAVSRIDIDALLKDVQAELESRPTGYPQEKTQIEHVASWLLHSDQKKYIGNPVATWDQELTPPANHLDAVQSVRIPTQEPGVYRVTARMEDGNEDQIVLWVHDTAIVRKQLDSGTMYFVADAESGAAVANARLDFFGIQSRGTTVNNVDIRKTSRHTGQCNENGIFIGPIDSLDTAQQWMVVARTDDGRLAYSGFESVWRSSNRTYGSRGSARVFCMTDRPVYRPGQDVKFHLWIRQAGAGEELPLDANRDFSVIIRDPMGLAVSESVVTADEWGGIDWQWSIPEKVALGEFAIEVESARMGRTVRSEPDDLRRGFGYPNPMASGEAGFLVEEYRKPEFEVEIHLPQTVAQAWKANAVVSARYYFGEPVTNATLQYKVELVDQDSARFPEAEWDWLYGKGYLWRTAKHEQLSQSEYWQHQFGGIWYSDPWFANPPRLVKSGQGRLNDEGTFTFDIDGTSELQDAGRSGHYRITAEVTDRSRRTITSSMELPVDREPWHLFVRPDRGHYQPGDTATLFVNAVTADGQPCRRQGTATLFSIRREAGVESKHPVANVEIETDLRGQAAVPFAMTQPGQFEFSVQLRDAAGREQSHSLRTFSAGPKDDGGSAQFEALELVPDRPVYQSGERAVLQINTNKNDSTVLLFVRSLDGVCPKPDFIRVKGKSTTFVIDLLPQDSPLFFVEALTVANGKLHSAACRILVPPAQHVAKVDVLPATEQYRPGEKATVQIRVTDLDGMPFVGSTVISVYDASLEAISPGRIPDIRSFFWNRRRAHYIQNKCTLDRVTDSADQPPERTMQQLQPGTVISDRLWFGGFGGGFFGGGGGFGSGGFGGGLGGGGFGGGFGGGALGGVGGGGSGGGGLGGSGFGGGAAEADSRPDVLNGLTAVEEKAIVFAPTALRSEFADTAFWTGTETSDANGVVEFAFTVPENLTTWRVRAWALGDGTRVGSGVSQIISSKNLIIRPQVPRFFTETDRITISAVVHNYLDQGKSCRVVLESEGGEIQLPDDTQQSIMVPANGEARVDWNVSVISSGVTKIRMKALTDEESDATELSVPVQVHGFRKKESFSQVLADGIASISVRVTVPHQRIEDQSRLEIRFCPSLAGTMVEALPFLIEYPHGCTEQTLNHFLPAVITRRTLLQTGIKLSDMKDEQQKQNPAAGKSRRRPFANPVFDEGLLNFYVSIGLDKLVKAQCPDGGWGWFAGTDARATAHLTAQVVHGLRLAQEADVAVPEDVLDRGVDWLHSYQASQLTLLRKGNLLKADPPKPDAATVGDPPASKPASAKLKADEIDAFVAFVLSQTNDSDQDLSDYLYRDLKTLSVYSRVLTGLTLAAQNDEPHLQEVLANIEQFLDVDEETQTAWLRTTGRDRWAWYESQTEMMARYLQLLLKADKEQQASRVVRYLLSNRRNGAWWDSTRDTALVIEALADQILITGEAEPNMTVEVLLDGVVKRQSVITRGNLFSTDNVVLLEGKEVTSGPHQIELRRVGPGPVYLSVQLTNFTKEERLTATGLEVKVQRRYCKVIQEAANVRNPANQKGTAHEPVVRELRIPINDAGSVVSGDLVEVELLIDSKGDYEYLLLEDHKPSGFEPDDRLSGYTMDGLWSYRELRDDRVCYYLEHLPRGQHTLRYRLRAENPGEKIVALPATIEGMYSPDLAGNADEFRLKVIDRP